MDPFDPQLNPAQTAVGGYQTSAEDEAKARRFWLVSNLMPSLIRAHPTMKPADIVVRARLIAKELEKDL